MDKEREVNRERKVNIEQGSESSRKRQLTCVEGTRLIVTHVDVLHLGVCTNRSHIEMCTFGRVRLTVLCRV